MAELAASVIGIVSAGTKVTLVLSQLAVDIGSAGREARMISNEIRSFCAVVKTLGETLEKVQSSSYCKHCLPTVASLVDRGSASTLCEHLLIMPLIWTDAHCTDMTKDMTAASLEMFTELLNATESIRGLTRSKEGKISVVGRVQWAIFRKPKIAYLRAAIEAYKSNLTLMLGTLNTAEKVTRQISVAITPEVSAEHEQDQLLLQSLELDQQSSLSDLEQAEREYQEADDPGLPSNDGTAESSSPTAIAATASEATATSRTTLETDSYVNSARDEIESIRASLSISLSAFDPSAVQQQVVQYSRRLSILVSADQKRISQRWSSIPDSLPSTDTETDSNLRGNPHDPSYNTLRDQLLVRQPYFRKAMLERLVREVYYHAIKLPYMDVEESNLRRLITEQVNPATSRQQRYWVDLSRTDLSNIPETIIDVLPKPLSNLNLAHNRLQEIPLSLTLCQKLTNINLSNNRLERFPEPVLHIHTLQILHLRDNQLTAIPATITNLQKLSWLGIQNNMITGLPFVLADLPELISLHHWGNPIGFPSVKLLDMYTEEQLRNDPKPLTDTNHIHTKVVKEYLAHYPEDVSEI
ncbi:hypothetical protein BDV96DRAFT_372814 [Lophiotrema nucula]|uniref:Uncharacterized protein n=1 Tax=Lophiotrema nucula TaxID=690887 RepID=A0A6A5ZI60_9PLEO|nr:hypothetical protein BDV96DRAFT_372814 [Lophiotrema nucula]